MILPRLLRRFAAKYRLSVADTAKIWALYPVAKLHHWHFYGPPARRWLASGLFKLLRGAPPLTISMFFPSRGRYVRVPVWLESDRLASFQEIFLAETYSLPERWAPRVLVDAGANVGYATLYFAAHLPIHDVLAIEPNPQLVPCLRTVAERLAECGVQVKVAAGALVGAPRTVSFAIHDNSRDSCIDDDSGSAAGDGSHVRVRGLRLTEWLDLHDLGGSAAAGQVLLKMDIEGGEHEIIRDNPEAFRSIDLLVAEIHGGGTARDHFANALAQRGHATILDRRAGEGSSEVEIAFAERG